LYMDPYCRAQYNQIDLFPDDSSYQLIQKLVVSYKPQSVLDYSQARIKMYREIYNHNDSVSCMYTRHTLFLDPVHTDPIGFLSRNGDSNGINCEHSFPQSKGADSGNARSDMHHLFPCRAAVNEARSNFPYAEIEDSKVTSWFYKWSVQSSIPSQHIDEYSESIFGLFEPREDVKGNVARAIFYFITMYELQSDRSFFERMRSTLCDWHLRDPVDSLEWTRSQQIAKYQEFKANPFILDCSLVNRTYCPNNPVCKLNTLTNHVAEINMKLQENPVLSELSLQVYPSDVPFEITIRLNTGQVVYHSIFNTTDIKIDANFMLPGLYVMQCKNKIKKPASLLFVKL
jgi:hypothetical protein